MYCRPGIRRRRISGCAGGDGGERCKRYNRWTVTGVYCLSDDRTEIMRKEQIVTVKAFQDYYPAEFAHCFGCGRLNKDGLQVKSYWDGEESVCYYTPKPYFTGGFPGYVYGGFIASLMDCHSAATASAAKLRAEGSSLNDRPISRFVSASLKVDYLKPTPIGKVLELRGR